MGTLSSALAPHMREALAWDVLFVVEDDSLRRATDEEHYRLAHQLRRTIITLDRDYLDDRRFPPEQSGGVLVMSAPDDRRFSALLTRIDRVLFHPTTDRSALPLEGRKLQVHTDWRRDG